MGMEHDEIFEKVRETLVDALGVDDDEVTPDATLTTDLGAESIDFLDIVFRLEKAFEIKIPRGELFPDNVLNNPDYVKDGKVTAEGLAVLKERGFVLGIVTDTIYPIGRKMRWLNQVGVAEFIDVVACSTVVGAQKPDPAIYLEALQQAHLKPYEAAFVGHAADELEGARSAGLAAVAVLYEADAEADHYAESLLDLLDVPIFQAHK